MAKVAAKGRQGVIEAAATMLALHGLRGISIREVTKFAGAPLGSTYHNFPGGKQQIVTEAILWAGEQASAQLRACLATEGHSGMNLFLSLWRERLSKSEFRSGCPIVAAAIEAPREEDGASIQAAVSQVFSQWQVLIAQHLMTQGHSSAVAQTRALGLIAGIEGALVMCRAHKNLAPLDALLECLHLWTTPDTVA